MSVVLVLSFIVIAQTGAIVALVYFSLRADGRLKPVSVEKMEAEARLPKPKTPAFQMRIAP